MRRSFTKLSFGLVLLVSAVLARPVDRYLAAWATPPSASAPRALVPAGRPSPPDVPYAGNGDVTAVFTGNASADASRAAALGWQAWLHFSKNDLWGSDSASYYPHLSAGRVGILAVPAGAAAGGAVNASVAMFPGNASIVFALTTDAGASVTGATRVLENGAVVTTLTCMPPARGGGGGGTTCAVTLTLSDTDANHFGVAQEAGAAADGSLVWWRKENLHNALNPAYLGPCDPHVPLQSTERAFAIDGPNLAMANGSCLWSDEAANPGVVTVGACTAPQGAWAWRGTAGAGDIVHAASAQCLVASDKGALALGPCGAAPWAQLPAGDGNASRFFIRNGASALACIVAVPDNNNNTLGVALGVADASGSLVPGQAARVSPTDASAGMSLTVSLAAGAEYTVLAGLQTLRDMGCAGVRPQWETCATSPQAAATALVRAMASTAARAAALQASDEFWASYWAASSVDLTSGAAPGAAAAQLATVERFYYMMQYLLACNARDGKVTPALIGFVCVEPVAWGDQFTLDYNLEAVSAPTRTRP